MTPPVKLWGNTTTRTMRPIWLLEELDVDYRLNAFGPRTGETKTAEYTSLNPKQKIPYMVDGEFELSESVAITNYLLEKYGDGSNVFLPKTIEDKAKCDEWSCFILSELDETSLYVIRRHQDLKAIYGDAPGVVDSAKAYFYKQLGAIESLRGRDFSHLVQDKLSIPDILLTTCLDWIVAYKMDVPEFLHTFHAGMRARPAYQSAFERSYGVSAQKLISR